MNKANYTGENAEIVTLEMASQITSLGISTIRQKGKECGALLKIGRAIRVDLPKLLDYLRTFTIN